MLYCLHLFEAIDTKSKSDLQKGTCVSLQQS